MLRGPIQVRTDGCLHPRRGPVNSAFEQLRMTPANEVTVLGRQLRQQ